MSLERYIVLILVFTDFVRPRFKDFKDMYWNCVLVDTFSLLVLIK